MAEPIRTGGGNVPLEDDVRELAAISPRRAGSEAERRAARLLQQRLSDSGRETRTEPTRIRPGFPLTNLIHAVLGVIGSVVSVYSHGIGLLIAAIAALSALGDLTGAYPGLRLLMPARASQNVVSDQDTGKPGEIILVAHYDAPRTGMLYGPRLRAWPRLLLGSLAVITVCALARVIGINGTIFTVIQFIPTVTLIALSPLFADAALSETSTGTTDNAAGVATALRAAEEYGDRLEHFDISLLFTGGSAHFGLGMRDWLKRHRQQYEPAVTAVICLDNLGGGAPRVAVKEGPVFASRLHPALAEIATNAGAERYDSRELSDAYLSRSAGLPTLRLSGAGDSDEIDPDELARTYALVGALLERIDSEIGAQIA